jgi:hypothetical protein
MKKEVSPGADRVREEDRMGALGRGGRGFEMTQMLLDRWNGGGNRSILSNESCA